MNERVAQAPGGRVQLNVLPCASSGEIVTRSAARFPWILLALGLALAHAPALAQGGGRGAQLEELLPRLARRAAVYKETALRFACVEEGNWRFMWTPKRKPQRSFVSG